MTGRVAGWGLFVVAFSSLNYAARFFAGPDDRGEVAYSYAFSVGALVESGLIFGIVLWISRGTNLRETLALRRPRSWSKAAAISVGVVISVVLVTFALAPVGNAGEEQGIAPSSWDSRRIGQFVAFAFVVALVGPLVEELMFRGVGYSLLEPYGQTVAIVVVGLAFALVHGLLVGFPIIAAFGLGLAYLRSRTGSVYPCILLHAAFNGTALALGVTS